MLVESEYISLGLGTRAVRNGRFALGMNLHHELVCLGFGIAKKLLQNKRDVRHQIDWIVPHEYHPWRVRLCVGPGIGFHHFEWRSCAHGAVVLSWGRSERVWAVAAALGTVGSVLTVLDNPR